MDHEPQWESLIGSQNSVKAQSVEDDTDSATNDTDDLLVSNDPSSLANLAPLSSISEVTLDKFPST
jgi:hypothetical protein